MNGEDSQILAIEQVQKFPKRGPVTEGIESASEKLTEFWLRHPLSNRDGLPFDEKVEEGDTAIFHLPFDRALPSEKRMKRVFDLDSALVAGIINNALASVATTVFAEVILESFL